MNGFTSQEISWLEAAVFGGEEAASGGPILPCNDLEEAPLPQHLKNRYSVVLGVKQTANIAKDLRYQVGKERARQFYSDENIMHPDIFDSVAWESLKDVIERYPKMSNCGMPNSALAFVAQDR